MRRRLGPVLLFAVCLAAFTVRAAAGDPAPPPIFEKDILPLFQAKCLRCHGADQRRAELDLRNRAAILRGGESGPAVAPGSPDKSLLWTKVIYNRMPPGKAEKLTDAERAPVRAWIEGGARDGGGAVQADEGTAPITEEDRRFWSFRRPVRPAAPAVKQAARVRNPIDAFLLAKLEDKGLTFAPMPSRTTLLRRVAFDLTGLPPTPTEIGDFLQDESPDAYEKVVDRLLATPRYGERWGRHWLDLAGYADSEGILDADYVRTAAWRYRDYVIRAFNSDKPYDRFLKEQIAGDELIDYWTAYHTAKELPPDVVESVDRHRLSALRLRHEPAGLRRHQERPRLLLPDARRHAEDRRVLHAGPDGAVRQLSQPQIRPHPADRLLPHAGDLHVRYRPSQWVPQVQRRLWRARRPGEGSEGR